MQKYKKTKTKKLQMQVTDSVFHIFCAFSAQVFKMKREMTWFLFLLGGAKLYTKLVQK